MASTTLYAGDSINLSTGVVTRSAPVLTSDDVPTTPEQRLTNEQGWFRESILRDSRKRVRRNDLSALAYVIRNGR